MKLKIYFLLLCLSTVCITSYSQTLFQQSANKSFTKYWRNVPQEKVYLHTDKPYYNAGEKIWFKAYLVNATTHRTTTQSRFVYVELITATDSVVSRLKIRKDSTGFTGHISLNPETLVSGKYVLRAYTSWMQNAGTDFFFQKELQITNSIDDRVFCDVTFGEVADGYLPYVLSIKDGFSNPFADLPVNVGFNFGSVKNRNALLFSSKTGIIASKVRVDTLNPTKNILSVSISTPGVKLKRQYLLPPLKSDFDVQFFPESGSLLQNTVQTVAFKAINSLGLSVDVEGKVFSTANNEICDIRSIYKGMGRFSILVAGGEKYYVVVKEKKSGLQKKFYLPESVESGVTLQFSNNKGKLAYQINNNLPVHDKALYLMGHARGFLYVAQPLINPSGQLPETVLPEGINSFSVVDSLGKVYCERLLYVDKKQALIPLVETDKPFYRKRQKVVMRINLPDSTFIDTLGNYSISITDGKYVQQLKGTDNIRTNLLLTSDIKGYVEEPADYFVNDSVPSNEKLNLLMLTQGWRRFDLSKMITNIMPPNNYYMEMGQVLSGKVLNLFNKPSKNCDIIALSAYKKTFLIGQTDSLGQFVMQGIEYPDSTTFVLKARKAKSLTDVELIPDVDVFPPSNIVIPFKPLLKNEVLDEYALISKDKYFRDGGIRVINLSELTVTAKNKQTENVNPMYAGADNVIGAAEMDQMPGMNVLDYIQRVPGVMVNGDDVSIRGANGNPLFIVDGFETDVIDDIKYLSSTEIESISVFKGPSATIFGSKGANGAIAITLKRGAVVKKSSPISMAVIKPLGYQKPDVFYSPKYLTKEELQQTKPDLRTTIYWNGCLRPDKNQTILVEFYTADATNNYDYVLEGVSGRGIIVRKTGQIRREL